jgi:hypothetical protein
MARMLARVPDPPDVIRLFGIPERVTMRCLISRGLAEEHPRFPGEFRRTPFGRETAERLARRGDVTV